MIHKKVRLKLYLVLVFVAAFLSVAFFYLPSILGDMAYPLKYADEIRSEAEKNNIPADLLAGLILAESSFNENSQSGAGAVGIVQMMPGTARGVAERNGVSGPLNLFNPKTSIRLGALHLKELFDRYQGLGESNQVRAALAAYNAGSGVADAWVQGGMKEKALSPAVRGYIKRIIHYSGVYQQMYADELGIREKLAFQNVASIETIEEKKSYTTTFWVDLLARTLNLKL